MILEQEYSKTTLPAVFFNLHFFFVEIKRWKMQIYNNSNYRFLSFTRRRCVYKNRILMSEGERCNV